MTTSVCVNTYTHSITYVSDNILRSLQDIVRLSGLSPEGLMWTSINLALKAWIESGHLETVILEVYNPTTGKLVARWDLEMEYGWTPDADGRFWVDTDQIKMAIRKAGVWPSSCLYEVVMVTKSGRPDVPGWGPRSLRSTAGFVKQSLGTTVEHCGLGAACSYYRRRN
jgi:hypothetical protein